MATAVAVARIRDGRTGPVPAAGRAALAAGAAVALVAATWSAAHAEPPAPEQAQAHAHVLPEVVDALEADDAPGDGRDGRYLVRSDDPVMGGLSSYTLLLELERQGFDVGIDPAFAVDARRSRVLAPDDATAVLTYVVGPAIDSWRARPDAVELAHVTPPGSDAGRDAPDEIVRAELRRAGLDDLAAGWDGIVLSLALDTTVPDDTLARIGDRLGVVQPIAVFLAPAG